LNNLSLSSNSCRIAIPATSTSMCVQPYPPPPHRLQKIVFARHHFAMLFLSQTCQKILKTYLKIRSSSWF
jgi:hypothetical protein